MSRHPLDALSLGFGIVFLVMAVAGLGEAAGWTGDGLAVAAVGIVLVAGLVGLTVSFRRLSTGDPLPSGPLPAESSSPSETVDPEPTEPASGSPEPQPEPTEPAPEPTEPEPTESESRSERGAGDGPLRL